MASADASLRTDRLSLRPWRVSDAGLLRALWGERDERVPAHRRLAADGTPTVADLEARIREEASFRDLLVVEVAASESAIGYCGLVGDEGQAPELAFELLRSTWGRGYATEAAAAVVERARAQGRSVLTASVWDWNLASRRVLTKLGFEPRADRGSGGQLVLELELRPT